MAYWKYVFYIGTKYVYEINLKKSVKSDNETTAAWDIECTIERNGKPKERTIDGDKTLHIKVAAS